jgi:hypothetical protein
MFTIIFYSLTIFFNACMDAFENENFGESIFKRWSKKFWYKRESWKWARRVFGYKLDGWHICKSLCIIFFVSAALAFRFEWDMQVKWQDITWYLFWAGAIWVFEFWIFYHKLFKIK